MFPFDDVIMHSEAVMQKNDTQCLTKLMQFRKKIDMHYFRNLFDSRFEYVGKGSKERYVPH